MLNEDILMEYVEGVEKAYAEMSTKYSILTQKYNLLHKAFEYAGQYARNNLPAYLPEGYLEVIIEDNGRYPEGKQFMAFWLLQAEKELKRMRD